MSVTKKLEEICRELKLNYSEETIEILIKLLESGATPDCLVKIIRQVEAEKSCNIRKDEDIVDLSSK